MLLDSLSHDITALSLEGLMACRRYAAAGARRTRQRGALAGATVSRRLGRGLDFAELKPYQHGDDVRSIDWKVTARRGATYTKHFHEERDRPVLMLVDLSASMRFATRGAFKSVRAAQLAAALAWQALARAEAFGGVISNGERLWHCPPKLGRRAMMRWLQCLYEASECPPQEEQTAVLERLVGALVAERRAGGAVVHLISDHAGLDLQQGLGLERLRGQYSLLGLCLSDPLERRLPPPGSYPMKQADGPTCFLNTRSAKDRHQFAAAFDYHHGCVRELYRRQRSQCLFLGTETPLDQLMREALR